MTNLKKIVIIFLSILILNTIQNTRTQTNTKIPFSCEKNVTGRSFDVQELSGDWYEAARAPTSEVPACVKVTAPNTIVDDEYVLRLDYINNVNKQWKPVIEDLKFPWNANTSNGIFEITYGDGAVSISFIFKIMGTDYKNLAIICYYTTYLPSLTMIKIMTRKQKLSDATISLIQEVADKEGYGSLITFVEQSPDSCNSANTLKLFTPLLFLIKFVIRNYF